MCSKATTKTHFTVKVAVELIDHEINCLWRPNVWTESCLINLHNLFVSFVQFSCMQSFPFCGILCRIGFKSKCISCDSMPNSGYSAATTLFFTDWIRNNCRYGWIHTQRVSTHNVPELRSHQNYRNLLRLSEFLVFRMDFRFHPQNCWFQIINLFLQNERNLFFANKCHVTVRER